MPEATYKAVKEEGGMFTVFKCRESSVFTPEDCPFYHFGSGLCLEPFAGSFHYIEAEYNQKETYITPCNERYIHFSIGE